MLGHGDNACAAYIVGCGFSNSTTLCKLKISLDIPVTVFYGERLSILCTSVFVNTLK